MKFTAQQIADMLEADIEGDPEATVSELAKIEEGRPETLSFLANPQYNKYLYTTRATAVIVSRDFQLEQKVSPTLIRVDDAYGAFAKLLQVYEQMQHQKSGIHPRAIVSDSAQLGEDVYIGAGTYVGENVKIGTNSKIYENVTLGDNCQIGEKCWIFSGAQIYRECHIGHGVTIHSGAILGADGFGFAPNDSQEYNKVAQIGNVRVEDGAEIGANTAIDRATLGSTVIGKGVKLDNLIQIGHNVEIGDHTVIAGQSGIAGSTKVGSHCMIGGQVGIAGHLKIGDRVKIAAKSGIQSNVPNDAVIQGAPAFKVGDFQKSYVYFRKLPGLVKRLEKLEKAHKDKS